MIANIEYSTEKGKNYAINNFGNPLKSNGFKQLNVSIPYDTARLNIPVSIVEGTKPKIVSKMTLGTLLNQMQTGDPLSIETAEKLKNTYISYIDTGDKKQYTTLKENLFGFIVGEWKYRNDNAENCLVYVPLLVIDIDGYKDDLEMSWDLEYLKQNTFVFAAFPSPSVHGLRVLVWCESTFETHKSTYTSLVQYLEEWLNMTTDKEKFPHLDTSTSNPSRYWYFTHTTDVFVNIESKVFIPSVVVKPLIKKAEITIKSQNTTNSKYSLNDSDKMVACIEIAKRRNISDAETNPYVHSVACIAVEHGISKTAILDHFTNHFSYRSFDKTDAYKKIEKPIESAFKRTYPKYSEEQLLKYINKGNTYPIEKKTVNTTPSVKKVVLNDADKYTFEADKKGAMNEAEEYISERYDLRFNYILNEFEISLIGRNNFTILNQNDLLRELQKEKIKASDRSLRVSLLSSFVPRYNPIQDYFLSLENKWKAGDIDHIAQFSSYIETTDQYFFNHHFKKMVVRVVACALGYIPFNKHCFTLYSTQNDGKTSLFRSLCPPFLKPYYKENLDIDKDGRLALCQNLFINLDELKGLSKADINEIKTYFSLENVKDRPPYGDKPLIFKRTASFFASTNNRDFLTDETGNVRWLVFEVKKINHDRGGKNGYMSVDVEAIWAQAVYLLKNDFEYQLTPDEIAYSEKNNKIYTKTTYEMELIQEYFESGTEELHELFLTVAKIKEELEIGTTRKLNHTQLGRALTTLGFPSERKYNKISKNTVTGYYLKKRQI